MQIIETTTLRPDAAISTTTPYYYRGVYTRRHASIAVIDPGGGGSVRWTEQHRPGGIRSS